MRAALRMTEPQRQTLQASYESEQASATDPSDAAPGMPTPVDTADPVAQMRASAADELTRQNRITEICGTDHRTIAATAIAEGWDDTRTELEMLRASRPAVSGVNTGAGANSGGGGVPSGQVLAAAVCLAGGVQNPEDQFDEHR